MPAVELPPFTDTQREAVRRCRFVTPNVARTHAWCLTEDEATAAAIGKYTRYRRFAEPASYEYEIAVTHPDGVAFICDLVDGGR